MKVNGTTRVLGVIGNPIAHTKSPAIHNFLASKTEQNLVYAPFHVQNDALDKAIMGAYALDILGLNITVPYKSQVMESLVEVDELAKTIGAVNTLVRVDGGYKGYNTDMPGLYRAMRSDAVILEGEDVVILGAGGVARAVAILAAVKGANSIWILNRTVEKAQKIADEVNGLENLVQKPEVHALPLNGYGDLPEDRRYLAIQATNIGMYPKTEETVIEDPAFYEKLHTGYDLIFNPMQTSFMKRCVQNGKKAYGGLKMLVYQGIIAYELWTGISITDELADEVYEIIQ